MDKFEIPFTGTIPIPRGTFQLSTPTHIKPLESANLPQTLKSSSSSGKLISEMQKMIPFPEKKKNNLKFYLKTSLRQMKSLKINPDEIEMIKKNIPLTPFGRNNSRVFFSKCKEGDLLVVEKMLSEDKYLAHVFDPMKMTALHWAALRGFTDIAKVLLNNTAYVDAVDCVFVIQCHRTPLHIAAKQGFTEVVKVLIKFSADPSILTDGKKTPLQMAKNEDIARLLNKYTNVFLI